MTSPTDHKKHATRPVDFDDLPEIRKPNPLPCGCCIMGRVGINLSGTRTENRDMHVHLCQLHAAAPDMADALAAILVLINGGASDDDLEAIEEHCRAALSKAWGVPAEEVTTPDLEELKMEEEA